MIIKSDFENNGKIPKKYTCDGDDINPLIEIIEAPVQTKSIVFIVDDPDAPNGTWVHWVLYDISYGIDKIQENSVPNSAKQGMNDFKKLDYGGPCPPSGSHRYFFKVYALDIETLGLDEGATKKQVEERMRDHILASAELIGIYSR